MLRKLLLPVLAIALLWAVGCSDNATSPDDTQTFDLNAKFGGFTATSESPGFGDSDLLGEASEEEDFDDPLLLTPAVDSLIADPDAGFFHFRVVWGRLTYDSTVTEVTDWSGSLTISRGAEIVRRLIRFEEGQDYVLERTDPKVIEWVSATTVHHDGIAVDMFVPRPVPTFDTTEVPVVDTLGDTTWNTVVDTVYPAPATIAFETGPYSHEFTLGDLVALDTVIYLDDSNAVAFHAFKLERVPCARGFLSGQWGTNDSGQNVFRGMWMSRHGFIDGWLQGRYGKDDNGRRVFFGKWIDRSGNFEGLLQGTYNFHPNHNARPNAFSHAGGWFKGTIHDADEMEIGVLKGRFHGPDHPNKAGFFQGLWRLYCGDSYYDGWDNDHDDDGWDDDDYDDDDDDDDDEI